MAQSAKHAQMIHNMLTKTMDHILILVCAPNISVDSSAVHYNLAVWILGSGLAPPLIACHSFAKSMDLGQLSVCATWDASLARLGDVFGHVLLVKRSGFIILRLWRRMA